MNHTFAASRILRAAYIVAVLFAPFVTWFLYREGERGWLHAAPFAGIAAVFFAWPRAIHFDDLGIWQRNLWGRKLRILWQDVDALGHGGGKTIVGGGKVQIVHTEFHPDKKLFCELIEQRTGTKLFVGGF